MLAWRSHIEGAVQIVKIRGRSQLCKTRTGALLFNGVRHHLVSISAEQIKTRNCTDHDTLQISRILSMGIQPPMGVDWWMEAGDAESLLAIGQRFALRAGDLRAKASQLLASSARTTESVELMLEMARRLQSLDREIATWLDRIPAKFRAETLCWVDSQELDVPNSKDYSLAEVFPGRVDVYPDFVTASAWNLARVLRLFLASVNIRIAAWLSFPADYHVTAEYATSKVICEEVIIDIIASVPYNLGWHVRREGVFRNRTELSGFACGEEAPFKSLPAYFLLWPLTCIKNHDLATDDQRAWVKGRLKFIEEQVGLKYARIVNDVSPATTCCFNVANALTTTQIAG